MHKYLYTILVTTILALSRPVTGYAKLLTDEGFETQNFVAHAKSNQKFEIVVNPPTLSKAVPAREGENSVRFFVDKRNLKGASGPNLKTEWARRSMLMLRPHPDNYGSAPNQFGIFDSQRGEDFWYGFSVFLPADWLFDSPNSSTLIWQEKTRFHYDYERDYDGSEGPIPKNPPLSLQIAGDEFRFQNRFQGGSVSFSTVQTGCWNDFVLHIRYAYGANGLVEIYQNGVLAYQRDGQTNYKTINPIYEALHNTSFGIYKWNWLTQTGRDQSSHNTEELYFDAFRIGDKNSSYSEVAPRGTSVYRCAEPILLAGSGGLGLRARQSELASASAPAPSTDLIRNGDFSNDARNWFFHSGSSDNSFSVTNGTAVLDLSSSSDNIQLLQPHITVSKGNHLTLSFHAKASKNEPIRVYLHRHTSPYDNFGLNEQVDLTPEWQTYRFTFTATNSSGDGRLRFWLPGAVGSTIEIDDVSLIEK